MPCSSAATGTAYQYNSQDELAQEQSGRNGGSTYSSGYDAAFNPTTLRGATHSFNSDNQDTAFTFDNNGNPTLYGGTGLTFDPENRLTAYGSLLTAGYNGDNLRAWKQNGAGARTYFLYDHFTDMPVCELDSTGAVTAANTFGPWGLLSRHTTLGSIFYTFDPQGSVVQRLDANQNVLSTSVFDAFGSRLSAAIAGEPWGYDAADGYFTDSETGLQLLMHRYYDPAQGRFLNRDPLGYGGGVNLYGYAGNDATTQCDPGGLAPTRAGDRGCTQHQWGIILRQLHDVCRNRVNLIPNAAPTECLRRRCGNVKIYCARPGDPGCRPRDDAYTNGLAGTMTDFFTICPDGWLPAAGCLGKTILHEMIHTCGDIGAPGGDDDSTGGHHPQGDVDAMAMCAYRPGDPPCPP